MKTSVDRKAREKNSGPGEEKPERIARWEGEGGRSKAPPPRAALPRVKKVFALHAPNAREVKLVGDFTNWETTSIALEKNKNGTWQTTVELEPGEYSYRYLVDGEWWDDPQCSRRAPNPYGGWNSQVEVQAP
jgi:hypothetical protein